MAEVDKSGYITRENVPISKAGVFFYSKNSPGFEWYKGTKSRIGVLKAADELSSEETLKSIEAIPVLPEHVLLGEGGIDPNQVPSMGAIAGVYWDAPFIKVKTLKFYSSALEVEVQSSNKRDVSLGTHLTLVPEEGTYEGQTYDFRAVNIRGNHLALCPIGTGRAEIHTAILDSNTGTDTISVVLHDSFMEDSLVEIEDIIKALETLSDEDKAKLLAALTPAITEAVAPAITEAVTEAVAPAITEAVAPAITEAVAPAVEEAVTEAVAPAITEAVEEAVTMDSIIKELSARNSLAQAAAKHIGSFAFDSMTTAQVAAYVAKKLGVKFSSVEALSAYISGLNKVNTSALVTFDSKAVAKPLNNISAILNEVCK